MLSVPYPHTYYNKQRETNVNHCKSLSRITTRTSIERKQADRMIQRNIVFKQLGSSMTSPFPFGNVVFTRGVNNIRDWKNRDIKKKRNKGEINK